MRKLLSAVAGVIALASVSAYAAGLFPGLPIVGGASYCGSFSTGVSGQVCTTTVPAGPSTTTGNELIPADTQLSQGQAPQTVLIPITVIGAGANIFNAPLTGATIAVPAATSNVVLNPAGTIAALTLTLDAAANLKEGQILRIGSSQVVTALTLSSGTGTSIVGGPTTIAAAGGFELIYHASNATNGTWYRLQ